MDERVSIGQTLRQRREERGLTPEQAALQSKVPLRLLQALEADDYRQLPDAAYLIRFLYEYARLLKLDPAPLEGAFRSAIRRPPGTSFGAVLPPSPAPAIPWRQVLWTAAAVLVATPLVLIVLSLASKRAAERPALSRSVEEPTEKPASAETPVPTDENGKELLERLHPLRSNGPPPGELPALLRESPSASGGFGPVAPSTADGPGPPPPAPPSRAQPGQGGPESFGSTQMAALPPVPPADRKPRRFLLTARALEPTWMRVRIDGGQVREVLLEKGQTARFAADAGFVITVGNAGGVDLSLNGERIPPLGASGQVVRELPIPPVRLRPGATDSHGGEAAERPRTPAE